MAITNGYCTLAELQREIGRTVDANDSKATYLEETIEEASRMIDEYTYRIFYSNTITDELLDAYAWSENGLYIDAARKRIMFPAPIISISSITQDGESLTENTDYYQYNTHLESDGNWTSERVGTSSGIKITATYGYSSVPEEIKSCCKAIAAAKSGLRTKVLIDDAGGENRITDDHIPSWVWKTLKKHKRVFV